MTLIQDFLTANVWAEWLLLIGVFLVVGWLLVKWTKDERVWFVLITAALGLMFMLPPKEKLKLGIDLQGGTILVYQVDMAQITGTWGQTQMDQMIGALSKRVNPSGTVDMTIRPMGGDRIEIILPAADPQEVQAIQDKITQMGQLEFRILANEKHDGEQGNRSIKPARDRLANDADINFETESGRQRYQWVKIFDKTEVDEFGRTPGEAVAVQEGYVLTIVPEESMSVTGDELSRVEPTQDRQFRPAVGFHFDATGTRKFGRLTRKYQPEPDEFRYKLAIILDGKVMSAPAINSPIESGDGIIEGEFTAKKVQELVDVLNAGKLPAMLKQTPISKDTVTATLGEDTIRQGTIAIVIAMIVVPIFMLAYYLFSGLVANIALLLNVILILGFMGFSQSTFTLPGLAGLALTIGMAVDANVLIFERMREERERGSSLRQAIRNGFDRAWLAIFDSNLTTIITAAILWWLGTDQVKGFALTLMIGLLSNLFTAVFVGRVIFDIWEKNGWIHELKMFHLIKTPSLDYVTPRYYYITASAIVIGIGLAVTFSQGFNLLDIDFTGGTAVSVRLTDTSLGADYVRGEAEEAGLPNVKVERLIPEGATKEESLFLVRTTMQEQTEVRRIITEHFHGKLNKLATVDIAGWDVEPIEAAKSESKEEGSEQDKAEEKKSEDKPAGPFAGGSRVSVMLNRDVSRDALAAKLDQTLAAEGLSDPTLHYSLRVGGLVERFDTNKDGTVSRSEIAEGPTRRVFDGLVEKYKLDAEKTYTLGELRLAIGERDAAVARNFILETSRDPETLRPKLATNLQADPIYERENNFKSQVAGETRINAIWAMVLSWVAMIVYLWFRFKNVSYGFAAVVALVHDVLVALGFVAIGGFKIDLTIVTAFMTIIGYSVNDTIVIFDRIREIKGKSPFVTAEMINQAVNQCMSRTILTSLTVIVVLVIMFFWGGPGIHGLSYAMLIGCLSGTYSTIFIAAPILIMFAGKPQGATSSKGFQYQGAAVLER